MSEVQHTPEPWQAMKDPKFIYEQPVAEVGQDDDGEWWIVQDHTQMHEGTPEGDARRIVAAVNACRGYLTEMLENGIIEAEADANRKWETTMMEAIGEDGYKSVAEAIAKIKAERDEARAMVKELAAVLQTISDYGTSMTTPARSMDGKTIYPAEIRKTAYAQMADAGLAKAKALS